MSNNTADASTKKEPRIRRAYSSGQIPSDDFISGQIAQCESIMRICEREHFQVNGRRRNTHRVDNQTENYIAGRQRAYSSLITFLENQIQSYQKTLAYKARYADILANAGALGPNNSNIDEAIMRAE
jgi:hypothetical protein